MLRRICTILAILAGIGVIVLSQTQLKEKIQGVITQRDDNAKERDKQRARAEKTEKTLMVTSNDLISTTAIFVSTSNALETAQGNLAQANDAKAKLQGDLQKSRDETKSAQQELAQWAALGVKPEQVRAMQTDFGKSQEENVVLKEEKKLALKKIVRLENDLKQFLDPENLVQMPGLKGNVVVVDPKWDFVVLDVGEKQGALNNGIMMVHRDSKLVGKVRITSVLPDRSIANILPGWKMDDIREGDKVMF